MADDNVERLNLQWRITQLEELLAQRDHRLSLAIYYDTAKLARIAELEEELATWRKLKNSEVLLDSLMRGEPAPLDRAQVGRLLLSRPIHHVPDTMQ